MRCQFPTLVYEVTSQSLAPRAADLALGVTFHSARWRPIRYSILGVFKIVYFEDSYCRDI
jgi:hypothetical protein